VLRELFVCSQFSLCASPIVLTTKKVKCCALNVHVMYITHGQFVKTIYGTEHYRPQAAFPHLSLFVLF